VLVRGPYGRFAEVRLTDPDLLTGVCGAVELNEVSYLSVEEGNMSSLNRTWALFGAIAVGLASVLVFSGCTTPGKVGEMSEFDVTKASPDEIAKALKSDGRVAITGGFLFATDSATVAPGAGDLLKRISTMMKNNPDVTIAVVGHTDSTGNYKYNLQLSERRAKAVVDALEKDGVAATRLAPVGLGPLGPVASNDTPEGRVQNRRVELVLIR